MRLGGGYRVAREGCASVGVGVDDDLVDPAAHHQRAVGLGQRHADAPEDLDLGLALEGLGVDQHAVHVEDRRAVPGHGHAAYVHGFPRPGPLW
jgi:hypothetical protein